MKILALDTSTEYCSVALWCDGRVDARETLAGQRHSELVLGMVNALLSDHGFGLAALDGIAFGAGPGSFTGLRIACGVTQGLAFGADLPVVGVSTLAALAEAAGAARVVCCLDARMGQIYHASYERAGAAWRTVHAPTLCAPGEAPLPPGAEPWTGAGNGFRVHRHLLVARYDGRLSDIIDDVYPHAREVARLAVPDFELGRSVAAEAAVPVYIRDKVALRSDER